MNIKSEDIKISLLESLEIQLFFYVMQLLESNIPPDEIVLYEIDIKDAYTLRDLRQIFYN